MSIFIVLPINNPEKLRERIAALSIDSMPIPGNGNGFFVSYNGTAIELSNALGITDGSVGTGIVTEVASYYGRAAVDIWDWIKSRWEA